MQQEDDREGSLFATDGGWLWPRNTERPDSSLPDRRDGRFMRPRELAAAAATSTTSVRAVARRVDVIDHGSFSNRILV